MRRRTEDADNCLVACLISIGASVRADDEIEIRVERVEAGKLDAQHSARRNEMRRAAVASKIK